jgi:predicted dithiol-disulfide oxidoreductase (DUF899 family)
MTAKFELPEVVTGSAWLTARLELLEKEKQLTKERDALNADRRRLPMVRVSKQYVFEGPKGPVTLLDLFEGRKQLIVHHFMFAPEWNAPCSSCSSAGDGIGNIRQLHARNTSLVAVSRAPIEKLSEFSERFGWKFPWVSSHGSTFNYDFHATLDDSVAPVLLHFKTEAELKVTGTPWSGDEPQPWSPDLNGTEMPGISVFLRDGEDVYFTYNTFGRGIEQFHNGYPYLDITPLGRQESWEEPKGRSEALGLQVGGPNLRLPDLYGPQFVSGPAELFRSKE